jgi:hypothetical protein
MAHGIFTGMENVGLTLESDPWNNGVHRYIRQVMCYTTCPRGMFFLGLLTS